MSKNTERPYGYFDWLEYPVVVTATEDEIERGIDVDSPGFYPRDYRFDPKLVTLESAEGYPTELEQFYAWQISNQRKAIDRNRELEKLRDPATSMQILQQKILGSGDKFYITNGPVRRMLTELLTTYPQCLSKIDQKTLLSVIRRIKLEPGKYGHRLYRRYCDIANKLVGIITGRGSVNYSTKKEMTALATELALVEKLIQINIMKN